MRFIPQSDNETAGLVLFQNNENHLRAEITMEAGRLVFVVTTHIKGTDKKIAVADIMEYSITEKNPLWNICMICKEQEASIWIGTAEKSVKVAEKIVCCHIPQKKQVALWAVRSVCMHPQMAAIVITMQNFHT